MSNPSLQIQIQADASQALNSIASLTGMVQKAIVAFASFVAVAGMKDAADIAARNELLGVSLGVIGKNAGYSQGELAGYEGELTKLGITTGVAREALMQMISAGLRVGSTAEGSASQIALMARAAQDLAVVTGENSSATLQRMITNIQQLDTEGLRFMGVIVNLDEATAKYAAQVGKAAGALTGAEKQQALLNATMEQARGLQGAYEASLETVGKKLSSLARLKEEAAASIGDSLLPAYAVLVDAASAFLKKVEAIAAGIADNGRVAQVLQGLLQGVMGTAGQIGTALLEAVQSIAPALEAAFEKMQAAFAGLDLGGLSTGFELIVKAAADFGAGVVEAVGEAAPSVRLLVDALGMIVDSVLEAVKEFFGFAEGMGDVSDAGGVLSSVLQSIGLLLAGFADGLSLVKASGQILFSGLMVGFGAVANVLGDVVGLVNANLGQAFKQAGDNAIEMGMRAAEAARGTFEQFAKGETYVQKYADKLAQLPEAHRQEALAVTQTQDVKSRAFAQAEELVGKYVRAVNEGALAGGAAAIEYKKVSAEVAEMAKQYGFTQKEVEQLGGRLAAAQEKSDQSTAAFKALGLSAQEFGKQTSQAGTKAVEAFNQLAQSAKLSSAELYRAFGHALNMEKSLGGLKQYREAIDQVFKDGKIKAEEHAASVQLLGIKFEELFVKALQAAQTKKDFKQLEQQVKSLGEAGGLSGEQISSALQRITERAEGAREATRRLAEQQTGIAEGATRMAQADLEVTRAAIALYNAKNQLAEADVRNKKEGTDASRAALEVARLQVQLEEQKMLLALQMRAQESARMDVLIAQQQLLNAEKFKELNLGQAGAENAVQAAKDELLAKQGVLEKSKQITEATKQGVLELQQAVEASKAQSDSLEKIANATKDAAQAGDTMQASMSKTSDVVRGIATHNFASVVKQFQDMGMSLAEAEQNAHALIGRMENVVAFGDRGVAHYNQINAAIAAAKQHLQENAAEAARVESNYKGIKAQAEAIARGASDTSQQMGGWARGADAVAEAYQRIRDDARSAAAAGVDAARAFANSAGSIREELLSAQGRDDEAARSRFAQRKLDLQLEYELLKVKINAAIVTATAAGVSTDALKAALQAASSAFQQARSDLSGLESLAVQKAKDRKAEQNKAAAEDKAKQDEEARRASRMSPNPSERLDASSAAERVTQSNRSAQAAASTCSCTGGSAAAAKTIQVNFVLGSSQVPAQVLESDETRLLDMLKRARGVV